MEFIKVKNYQAIEGQDNRKMRWILCNETTGAFVERGDKVENKLGRKATVMGGRVPLRRSS